MKNILKVIVALGVFTMTIGSSFAMDTNPPTEPVKTTVETEVITEAPTAVLNGLAYFDEDLGECVWIDETPIPDGCSTTISTVKCMDDILGISRHIFYATKDDISGLVTCIAPLYEILKN